MNTPPLIGKKAQRLSNVTRAASAVRRTAELSGYVLYDCLDECSKRLTEQVHDKCETPWQKVEQGREERSTPWWFDI